MTDAEGHDHAADGSFRRASQYLTIPLGGLAPSHRIASRWVRAWRRSSTALLSGTAVLLAGAGAVVAAAPRTISVSADSAHVYLGGVVLDRASPSPVAGYTMYRGAAVVLLWSARATSRAAGAATINGERASGECTHAVTNTAALIERCTFLLRNVRVTAQDVFDPRSHVWRRTYSDGETADFDVPAGRMVVPIPLPLGR